MNLIDFWVKEIISETKGKMYELYGMTKEEAKNEEDWWKETLFCDGLKQELIVEDMGGTHKKTKFINLTKGEKPYKVGHKGKH